MFKRKFKRKFKRMFKRKFPELLNFCCNNHKYLE